MGRGGRGLLQFVGPAPLLPHPAWCTENLGPATLGAPAPLLQHQLRAKRFYLPYLLNPFCNPRTDWPYNLGKETAGS